MLMSALVLMTLAGILALCSRSREGLPGNAGLLASVVAAVLALAGGALLAVWLMRYVDSLPVPDSANHYTLATLEKS